MALRSLGSTPNVVVLPPQQLWGLIGSTINHSSAISPKVTDPNESVISSSMKDFALAVFNPATTSLTTYSGERHMANCDCSRMARSEKAQPCHVDIPHPVTTPRSALPAEPQLPLSKGRNPLQAEAISSISVRIVDSLSLFFDYKVVVEAVENDVRELMDALDRLVLAISRQTAVILKKSTGTAQVLREGFQYRNFRARGRAKELRDAGGQLISFAEEQLKLRAEMAKVKAKALKEQYLTSAAWGARSYGHRMSDRRERRMRMLGKHGKGRTRKLFCGGF